MTLAFFVGASTCGLRATGFGEAQFRLPTTGASLPLASSAGFSQRQGRDFTARGGAGDFFSGGGARCAVLDSAGASVTTGSGSGGGGSGLITFVSTFGGCASTGAGGRS